MKPKPKSSTNPNRTEIETSRIERVAGPLQARFQRQIRTLPTFPSVTLSMRSAIAWLGQLAIWSNAGLSVYAPKIAVVARRHRRVGLDVQIDPLPSQRRTEVRMVGIEALSFVDNHARSPFAACRMARFTATRASFILCLLWPRLLAFATAAAPAASAVSSETVFPFRA